MKELKNEITGNSEPLTQEYVLALKNIVFGFNKKRNALLCKSKHVHMQVNIYYQIFTLIFFKHFLISRWAIDDLLYNKHFQYYPFFVF